MEKHRRPAEKLRLRKPTRLENLMKFNIIDLEATCWEQGERPHGIQSQIIQIGICVADLHNKTISKPESIYVLPSSPFNGLTEFCTELTGITDEILVEKGISKGEAFSILVDKYRTHKRPWGSWGDYDRRMLDMESRYMPLINRPMSNQHLNIKLMYPIFTGRKLSGLPKAMKVLGLEFEGRHHDGADDAFNIARVLLHLSLRE